MGFKRGGNHECGRGCAPNSCQFPTKVNMGLDFCLDLIHENQMHL